MPDSAAAEARLAQVGRRRRRERGGERRSAVHRALVGALAGIAGTMAMTAAMRAMHRRLPAGQRYPLPPREIIEGSLPALVKHEIGEQGRQTAEDGRLKHPLEWDDDTAEPCLTFGSARMVRVVIICHVVRGVDGTERSIAVFRPRN